MLKILVKMLKIQCLIIFNSKEIEFIMEIILDLKEKKSRLHESFQFGYVLYCYDQRGKEYLYRKEITDVDNVNGLVKKFIENVGVDAAIKVKLED